MAEQNDDVASSGLLPDEESQMEPTSNSNSFEPTTSMSELEEASPAKQKRKIKNEKVCGVCGDKALGFNFNAITCESCKAFFRRNAFKVKSMECLFESNCFVDIRTRRFCPACRVKKCFKIGMNRDMILDDRERKKRQSKRVANIPKDDASSLLVKVKTEPDLQETVETSSSMDFTESERPATPEDKWLKDEPDVIFKHPPQSDFPTETSMYHKLTQAERDLLKKVTDAYCSTMGDPNQDIKKNYEKAEDLINQSESVVRKLIMFVKYLEDFKALSQEDQIACLKACVMHSLLLRSCVFYSIEKDAWLTRSEEYIPTSILKNATGFVSLHNSHVIYCKKMKSLAKDDINIYALMQILIIFDPSGPSISNRQFVSSIQDHYLIVLKHYLESSFSYKFAKQYFVSCVDRLCDLKMLSDDHAKILLQVNPLDIEPLMLEVLNLK